jgi:hypothetical protein
VGASLLALWPRERDRGGASRRSERAIAPLQVRARPAEAPLVARSSVREDPMDLTDGEERGSGYERLDFGTPEQAIPDEAQPSPEARAERDAAFEELRGTGAGGDAWRSHFDAATGEWLRSASRGHIAVELGSWQCFAGGCAVTARFEAVADLEAFSEFARLGLASKPWRGAGFRSGPIEADSGKIEARWIFYAPTREEQQLAAKLLK